MPEPTDKLVRVVGARITQARELRRLTKRDLADLVGVGDDVIAGWEDDRGSLRASNFRKLCAALNFPPAYFAHSASLIEVAPPSFRRTKSSGAAKNLAQASGYGRMVGEFLRVLDQTVGLPEVRIPFFEASNTFDAQEVAAIAGRVRAGMQLGLGPITNVSRAVEAAGVVICFAGFLDRRIDAYSTHCNGRPIMVLNADDPARLRLDVLHELGHLVMHRLDPAEDDLPQDLQVERLAVREAQAFRFASEMLMPATDEVREDLERAFTGIYWTIAIEKIKPKWGISLQAMVHRAVELGVLSEEQGRARQRDIGIKRWKKREPGGFAFPETPGLLWHKFEELKSIFPDAEERLARNPGLSTEFIRQMTARSPRSSETGAA